MKKIITTIFIFCLLLIQQNTFAINAQENIKNTPNLIEKIKIRKFIYNLDKYSNQQKLAEIKNLYAKDFQNTDNFEYEEYFKLLQETFDTYSDLRYKIQIKNIEKTNSGYKISIKDSTSGLLKSENQNFKYGFLNGESEYELFLKEQDGNLKIYKDNVLEEFTSLTYGEANFVKMELITPETIKEGDEYTIGLQVYPWTKSFIIASINNESIVNPPEGKEEVFRKLPKDGLLERIVTANKNNKNEYALASVGFTKASLGEDNLSINFKMSGIGFLLKRVNLEKNEDKI